MLQQALMTLGSPCDQNKTGDDGLHNQCNLVPLLDKNIQITPLVYPTCVNHSPDSPSTSIDVPAIKSPQAQLSPPNRVVRINKTSTPAASASTLPTTSQSPNPTTQSMHQSSPSAIDPTTEVDINPNESQPKESHDCSAKLLRVLSEDGTNEICYHVADFADRYPVWPIIEFSMSPTGTSKDERMTSLTKCVPALLGEMLYVNNKAMIAPLLITDNDKENYISNNSDLPSNFNQLGKYIMISGGSWVFNKKEKGGNDVNVRFRLKSQIPTEEIVNRLSFEFTQLSGNNLYKKQHQAMETETPIILLFVCNWTNQESIISDSKQMLKTALEDIKENRMKPKEFDNREIPCFTLRLNAHLISRQRPSQQIIKSTITIRSK
jgi:hypothetical protein